MIRRPKITVREIMSSKSTKFLVIISAASLAVFFASVLVRSGPEGEGKSRLDRGFCGKTEGIG